MDEDCYGSVLLPTRLSLPLFCSNSLSMGLWFSFIGYGTV